MDLQAARTKIMGFGMQLLDGIDPNPDNFVCAGIIHMRSQQVGCLLRLEPNKNAQVNNLLVFMSPASICPWFPYNLSFLVVCFRCTD